MPVLRIAYEGTIYELDFPEEVMPAAQYVTLMGQHALKLPKDVRNAQIVRSSDYVGANSEFVEDTITELSNNGDARRGVNVVPFPGARSGAATIITCENTQGETLIALVNPGWYDTRYETDPLKKLNIPQTLRFIEGYIRPGGFEGGQNALAVRPTPEREIAERQVSADKKISTIIAYQNTPRTGSQHHDPLDKNSIDCAKREVLYRSGLTLKEDAFRFVGKVEKKQPKDKEGILVVYHAEVPLNGDQPPTLAPIRTDKIPFAAWVKLNEIRVIKDKDGKIKAEVAYHKDGVCYFVPTDLRDDMHYAVIIGFAIQNYRNAQIQQQSRDEDGVSLFSSRENVEARIKSILKLEKLSLCDLLGISPEENFEFSSDELPGENAAERNNNLKLLATLGGYAENYHKKVLLLTQLFNKTPANQLLTAKDLYQAIHAQQSVPPRRVGSSL